MVLVVVLLHQRRRTNTRHTHATHTHCRTNTQHTHTHTQTMCHNTQHTHTHTQTMCVCCVCVLCVACVCCVFVRLSCRRTTTTTIFEASKAFLPWGCVYLWVCCGCVRVYVEISATRSRRAQTKHKQSTKKWRVQRDCHYTPQHTYTPVLALMWAPRNHECGRVMHESHTCNDADRAMRRGGGLGSRPKKMYGERLGDGVEYHSMKPTPRR